MIKKFIDNFKKKFKMDIKFPEVPNHKPFPKNFIVQYLAYNLGIRESLVTDPFFRKDLLNRIDICIRFRLLLNDIKGYIFLKDIKNCFVLYFTSYK